MVLTFLVSIRSPSTAQVRAEPGDPPNPADIPGFFVSTLEELEKQVTGVRKGEVEVIARSPGGLPVYAVSYGEREDPHTRANYNSAVAAGDPKYYADRANRARPVVLFLGPVHGQEVEGIAGLLNLIQVAETGQDLRGRPWTGLKEKMEKCRVIIIPCGNPDGRRRCPYDSFLGLPVEVMTKYGQGTHTDGTSWGWPMAKSVHPMEGDVGILGAYFNDDGINIMHDDFFRPMAAETGAILEMARSEAPDMTVSLHSHHQVSRILPAEYVPWYLKRRIEDLTRKLNRRYAETGLPSIPDDWISTPEVEDEEFPPSASFNLISALHHVSGTMAFTFECCHGTVSETEPELRVSYGDILDIQLQLYDVMLDDLLEKRLY
jgi:hypothetical protein